MSTQTPAENPRQAPAGAGTTESFSPRYVGIDAWPAEALFAAMIEGQYAAVGAVQAALPALAAAAGAAAERLRGGGRLVYAGAGTSARIAVQDGTELVPTFDWPADRLAFLIAGGPPALLRSVEGAEDDEGEAEAAFAAHGLGAADVVVSVAASGGTRYTRRVQALARAAGALTIGMANNPAAPLLAEAEHAILMPTGAEVVAGSTRMKAGTAQKIALNLFSTAVMVRLGRVYDGLMVDVQAINDKLVDRTRRMVRHLTGCDAAAAEAALEACGGHVKTAVLVVRGLAPDAARDALAAAGGDLRTALARLGLAIRQPGA
ncbi:MAG TPA: N-acetylmuramic acid 6-phosphate etherase [Alphaproteobacteria bacterium]|nr:N-acetylmuramic acid 6-phosphate etherase [Alphaproteobacteria bacterium]